MFMGDMMTYAITLDIDGTLLNRDGTLSDLTIKTIELLKDQGHLVMLATGRPLGGAMPIYRALKLTTPIVTDNGSCIDHPMDDLFPKQRTYMPVKVMHQLFLETKPYLISAFFNVEDIVYAYQYSQELEHIFAGLSEATVIEKPFDTINEKPTGMIFIIEKTKNDVLESYITSHFSNLLAYRLWGGDGDVSVYEIYLKDVSKSSAIQTVLNHYDIPKERWISFGDGINDIEMIRDAYLGVSMKNAHPNVIKIAKDVTLEDNHDDGLAKYLMTYFNLS